MNIKEIPLESRPRERMKQVGIEALSNAELLAIVLRTGTRQENVVEMCNRILSKHSLSELSELSLKELQEIKGIGESKAMQIKAIFEINKRKKQNENKVQKIRNAEDVFNYFREELENKKKEYFYALLLDSKNKIIKKELVSIGTLDSSLVHPREIFKGAIKNSAASIILVHNHPSGDPEPSQQDIEVTKEIVKAGQVLNIKVLDHVIIGRNRWSNISL